mmetsp:Transcript_65498/g.156525  ORF Transcript_65498/g.156525 Transcript_65498/m.156525 type:complete len:266 (-) Transcript_65498:379-1176(-)
MCIFTGFFILASREDPQLMVFVLCLPKDVTITCTQQLGLSSLGISRIHAGLRDEPQADVLCSLSLAIGSLLILLEVSDVDLGTFARLHGLNLCDRLLFRCKTSLCGFHRVLKESRDGGAEEVVVIQGGHVRVGSVGPSLGEGVLLKELNHLLSTLLLDVQLAGVHLAVEAHLRRDVVLLTGELFDQLLLLACSDGALLDHHGFTEVCHRCGVAAVEDADGLATGRQRIVELLMNLGVQNDGIWPLPVNDEVKRTDAICRHSFLIC